MKLFREDLRDQDASNRERICPVVIRIGGPCLLRRRDIVHVKIRDPGTSDIKSPATLSTSTDGGKKKEMKKLGGSEVIEGLNEGICSQQAGSTAFSAVILEVYEVCRNRISLYGHGGPLAICSRVDATPTSCRGNASLTRSDEQYSSKAFRTESSVPGRKRDQISLSLSCKIFIVETIDLMYLLFATTSRLDRC